MLYPDALYFDLLLSDVFERLQRNPSILRETILATVPSLPVSYWRTTSQIETDFVLGDHEVAIEVKSTQQVNPRHLKGLKGFAEEYKVKKLILVSTDPFLRKIGNIMIMPWNIFLDRLWTGEIIT